MDHSLSAGMAGYNSVGVSLGLDGFDRAATHDLHGAPGEGLGLSLSASHRHGHLDANGHHNQFLSDEHEDYHHRQFHLQNNGGLAAISRLRSEVNSELNFPPNSEGLVLGCIDADFIK